MNPEPPVVARTSGIEKSFGDGAGRIHVLKAVDFAAHAGEILMLVGPSGCGKTTLISAVAGTLRVDAGEIEVFGEPLHKLSNAALTRFRARHVGFIFQQFNLIPTLNLAENVGIPLQIQGHPARVAQQRAREVLAQVGLGDRWRDRPAKLSGGQQQRVAIARALVHEPPLLICDEPTAALDAANGEIVMDLFGRVARGKDRAVIVVTHDNRIFHHADRIAHMDDGRIADTTKSFPQPHLTS